MCGANQFILVDKGGQLILTTEFLFYHLFRILSCWFLRWTFSPTLQGSQVSIISW